MCIINACILGKVPNFPKEFSVVKHCDGKSHRNILARGRAGPHGAAGCARYPILNKINQLRVDLTQYVLCEVRGSAAFSPRWHRLRARPAHVSRTYRAIGPSLSPRPGKKTCYYLRGNLVGNLVGNLGVRSYEVV